MLLKCDSNQLVSKLILQNTTYATRKTNCDGYTYLHNQNMRSHTIQNILKIVAIY